MPTRSLSSRVAPPSTRSTESSSRVATGESGPRAKAAEPEPQKKSGWVSGGESGARVASTESGPRAKTTEEPEAPKKSGWVSSTESSRVGK